MIVHENVERKIPKSSRNIGLTCAVLLLKSLDKLWISELGIPRLGDESSADGDLRGFFASGSDDELSI